ncbi:MAG: hypothetical protein ACLQDQ_12770 [Myxococcaceae bacterium]
MRGPVWFAAGALTWPGFALAAEGEALDLRGGAVGELTARTLAIAHGLVAFLLLLGLVVELLRGPARPKRYLAVLWRTLVVLALLQTYTFLAGSLVKQCTSLAQNLASVDSGDSLERYRQAATQPLAGGAQAGGAGSAAGAPVVPATEGKPAGLGGVLFDVFLSLVVLLAGAVHWVFTQLSRILISFFYAIGPLALAFYVPGLDAPQRWLRSLVTVSCWPVVSSVLLNLSTAVLFSPETPGPGAPFAAVASSLLLCALAFATPRIASALVGGVGNLVAEGASAALRLAGSASAAGVLP